MWRIISLILCLENAVAMIYVSNWHEIYVDYFPISPQNLTAADNFGRPSDYLPQFTYCVHGIEAISSELSIYFDQSDSNITHQSFSLAFWVRGRLDEPLQAYLIDIVVLFHWMPPEQLQFGLLNSSTPNELLTIARPSLNHTLQVYFHTFISVAQRVDNETHFIIRLTENNGFSVISLSYMLYESQHISDSFSIVADKTTTGFHNVIIPFPKGSSASYIAFSAINSYSITENSSITFHCVSQTNQENEFKAFETNYMTPVYLQALTSLIVLTDLGCLDGFYRNTADFSSKQFDECLPCPKNCLSCFEQIDNGIVTLNCPKQISIISQEQNNTQESKLQIQANYSLSSNKLGVALERNTYLNNDLMFDVLSIMSASEMSFIIRMPRNNEFSTQDIKDNLVIAHDSPNRPIQYKLTELKSNVFEVVIINSQNFNNCNEYCKVSFQLNIPMTSSSGQTHVIRTQYFVTVVDIEVRLMSMPTEIKNTMSFISEMASITASNGLSQMLKMTFELEQLLEMHKYLHVKPVSLFQELTSVLKDFKFLDLTAIFPDNTVSDFFQFDETLSSLGPIKAVYYEEGANYIKNMTLPLLNIFFVWLINFILWLILSCLPCLFCIQLAKKLKDRAYCTFHDSLKSLIGPLILYGNFLSFQYVNSQYYYINVILKQTLNIFLLLTPIYTVIHISYQVRVKRDPDMIPVYSDIFLDCDVDSTLTKPFYVFAFYRRVLIAHFLSSELDGNIQISLLLTVNFFHCCLLLVLKWNNVMTGIVKFGSKFINVVALLIIQSLIAFNNNVQFTEPFRKVQIGYACLIIAFIATMSSLIDIAVRFYEIFIASCFQESSENSQTTVESAESNKEVSLSSDIPSVPEPSPSHKNSSTSQHENQNIESQDSLVQILGDESNQSTVGQSSNEIQPVSAVTNKRQSGNMQLIFEGEEDDQSVSSMQSFIPNFDNDHSQLPVSDSNVPTTRRRLLNVVQTAQIPHEIIQVTAGQNE